MSRKISINDDGPQKIAVQFEAAAGQAESEQSAAEAPAKPAKKVIPVRTQTTIPVVEVPSSSEAAAAVAAPSAEPVSLEPSAPEPPPTARPTAVPTRPVARGTAKTVEIKLELPSLPKLPKLSDLPKSRPYRTAKAALAGIPRKNLAAAGAAGAIAIAIGGYYLLSDRPAATTASQTQATAGLTKGTPDYPTLVPEGKDIDDLGGWTRVSPPDRNPVYAFVDKIGTVQISVSQQPLPPDFQTDTASKVAQVAQDFNATEKVTAGNATIYLGKSAKGPQSAILNKDELLILIKAAAPIPNDQWVSYIESLE